MKQAMAHHPPTDALPAPCSECLPATTDTSMHQTSWVQLKISHSRIS